MACHSFTGGKVSRILQVRDNEGDEAHLRLVKVALDPTEDLETECQQTQTLHDLYGRMLPALNGESVKAGPN